MLPVIIRKSKDLLHEQIYTFYRDAVHGKRITSGYRLPSHRQLAKDLGVSFNTVIRAYDQLLHEGYIKSQPRKGLFVAALEPFSVGSGRKLKTQTKTPAPPIKIKTQPYNLRGKVVDEKIFPLKEWRKMQQLAMDALFFQYDYKSEQSVLKDHLVKYLYYSRGVLATKERIVFGAGMNVLFTLLALMLKRSHKRLLFEEPGYPKARTIFTLHDYNVASLHLGQKGIDLAQLKKEKADLLYCTPSHQYPTGAVIPIANRLAILEWAKKNKAFIIEDDSECEFQHRSRLIPALQAIDKFDSVIYFGSFSNAIMPSLRIAYMVLPERFPVNLDKFEFLMNTVPYVSLETLAHFMERGFWERHLRKMRKLYKAKYYTCVHTLHHTFGNKLKFDRNHSGLNILLELQTTSSEKELMKKAEIAGIVLTPASLFYAEKKNMPAHPAFLFEFGSLEEEEIKRLVKDLYRAWFGG